MAADFRIVETGVNNRTMQLEKASATVIEAGDLVTLDANGLAIKAVAASTVLAFTEAWAGDGETTIEIIVDDNLILEGTWDAVYAESMRGTEVDLVGTTTLLIDVWASTTDVFKILPTTNAGTVGSTDNIRVKINKPII